MMSFQFPRPDAPVVMRPRWRDLLFLHWDYDPAAVQKLLPEGLEVDTFHDRAYIGLVPFAMENVRPHFLPNLGKLGSFYENFTELNVRTYVTHQGVRGVWFFSLDAASLWATITARIWFHLPYFKARMHFSRAPNGTMRFFSRRLWPASAPAQCRVTYQLKGDATPTTQGSLAQFLVERYVLYSLKNGQLFRGRVHHAPYQVQSAKIDFLEENCVQSAGFPAPIGTPRALYSRGVDVEVFPLERL